ncbi:MAG: ArsA-related P-loop ATPase [Actinomycetota bacterium]
MTGKVQPQDTNLLDGFSDWPPRFLFFAGEGGVGKTSLGMRYGGYSCRSRKKVLLVSTDPASNLEDVPRSAVDGVPTPVPGADGLFALNMDPEAAAQAYRDRIVGPYRGKLPEVMVRSVEERLSGACTMEIAAFDEFARLLGEPAATSGYDHAVFDTAPTGHTLRLLSRPRDGGMTPLTADLVGNLVPI